MLYWSAFDPFLGSDGFTRWACIFLFSNLLPKVPCFLVAVEDSLLRELVLNLLLLQSTDFQGRGSLYGTVDEFNNWPVELPPGYQNTTGYFFPNPTDYPLTADDWPRLQMIQRQMWITTANSSIICTLGNATQDVNF